jgi:ubiquinone/menaquinone biosynthesis C-methylase UbiE
MIDHGKGGFPARYHGAIPESVHLYALPPLFEAAKILQKEDVRESAENCLQYYLGHKDRLNTSVLTHFLGYELEALIDLGRIDIALPVLDALQKRQARDGSLRGIEGVSWVCSPGLVQIAICWYKSGRWEAADRALNWLERHQKPSGGFLGSYGHNAGYFPNDELSWAVKFYLDAHLLRVKSLLKRDTNLLSLPASDRLTQVILSSIKDGDQVLEFGSTRPFFSKTVHDAKPNTIVSVLPISEPRPESAPAGVRMIQGSLEQVSSPDESFDLVFSMDALSLSANPEASLAEIIRVAKPGGWITIIMGHTSGHERPSISWSWHASRNELQRLLRKGCDNVTVNTINLGDGSALVWRAQKRSRLSGQDWNKVLISQSSQNAVVDRVTHGKLSEWARVMLLNTQPGERVLEVGSGTGEISLQLAQAGRLVTAVDVDPSSVEFIQRCATQLGLDIKAEVADATGRLPFDNNHFHCTWSSGLLEHFNPEQRRKMLREWSRVTVGRVISLVPNAACVAYRAGKLYQEEHGTWRYGLEIPILSMSDDFEAAGLRVISEYSVGAKHALNFLPESHPLRRSLSAWFETTSAEQLASFNQGYLLATIGSKKSETARA